MPDMAAAAGSAGMAIAGIAEASGLAAGLGSASGFGAVMSMPCME